MKIKTGYRQAKALIQAWKQDEVKFINPALEDEFMELAKTDVRLSASLRLNRIGHVLDSLTRLIESVEIIEDAIRNKEVTL